MHYSNLVIIKNVDNVDESVEKAMGVPECQGGFWDWYQIGGRWTGTFDGYDPKKDPKNIESGKTKWPTEWERYSGDIMPIENLTEEHLNQFFRVVAPYHCVFGGQDYLPWKPLESMFPLREMPPLEWLKNEYANHFVVVVDSHS